MTPPRRPGAGSSTMNKGESNKPAEGMIGSSSSNNNNNTNNTNTTTGVNLNREGNPTRRRSYSPTSRHSSMEHDRGSRRGPRAAPRRI